MWTLFVVALLLQFIKRLRFPSSTSIVFLFSHSFLISFLLLLLLLLPKNFVLSKRLKALASPLIKNFGLSSDLKDQKCTYHERFFLFYQIHSVTSKHNSYHIRCYNQYEWIPHKVCLQQEHRTQIRFGDRGKKPC